MFGLQGIGQYVADSVNTLDLPPIMGTTLYAAFFIVMFSALVDIARPARPASEAGVDEHAGATVDDLHVSFATEDGIVKAVDSVSFDLDPGEILAIVGESGCGKSVTALTVMGLSRAERRHRGRSATATPSSLRWGKTACSGCAPKIAMVFQDPMSALNPVYRVGDRSSSRSSRTRTSPRGGTRARDRRCAVGIPNPERRARDYPHQFSGGMRQRAMIAMALSLEPDVLIADEPTTALDVTIQAQILRLLEQLNAERGLSVILITHDLGVVAEVADRALVMYAGRVVECGTLDDIFYDPQHPYTWGLLDPSHDWTSRASPAAVGAGRSAVADLPARGLPLPAPLSARVRQVRAGARPGDPPARAAGAPGRWLEPEVKRQRRVVEDGSASWRRSSERSRRAVARGRAPGQALRSRQASCSTGRSTASTPSMTSPSRCARARRSGSWASPAAGSRRSAARSCVWRNPPRAASGSGEGHHGPVTARAATAAPGDADDLPGPVCVPEPAQARGPDHRRSDEAHGLDSDGNLRRQVQDLLRRVGLSGEHVNRFPHEFSGGQRQRIGIASRWHCSPT